MSLIIERFSASFSVNSLEISIYAMICRQMNLELLSSSVCKQLKYRMLQVSGQFVRVERTSSHLEYVNFRFWNYGDVFVAEDAVGVGILADSWSVLIARIG